MDKVELGTRIRTRRRELNLSQGELGSLAGMSQAWVSRIEKGLLFPDLGQIETLESTLGRLSGDAPPVGPESVEAARGPAVYKATRLANENAKRRADLALRMESLQQKEDSANQTLLAERELAAAFVHEFIQEAVELPTEALAPLRTPGIDPFVAVDDETKTLIDVRNSVVQQINLQLNSAAQADTARDVATDAAAALAAYTAVESFAATTSGAAVINLGRAAVAGMTGARFRPYGAIGAGAGLRGLAPIGLAAAPALIAAGVVVTIQGRRMLTRAQDERSQLVAAGLELDQLYVVLDEYCSQAQAAADLLAHARTFGKAELERLREGNPDADLDLLVRTCALILTLLPLPIASEASDNAPLGETHRANELALETAEAWLVDVGAIA